MFVSAFDDDHVIAGNGGLLAREILAQLPDVQAIVVPVGGGGLAGGIGVEVVPRGIQVLGVSPEANCAMRRSLDDGRAYTSYTGAPTLAEGLEGAVSERTFAMARDYFPDIALVSELAIRRAIVYAYRTLGILCEASAAPALAALLEDASAVRGRRTVVVISGGNIEPDLLDQLLSGASTVGVCIESASRTRAAGLERTRAVRAAGRPSTYICIGPGALRLCHRCRAQLAPGRAVAQLLARLGAVAGAEHVAQVGLVLERVRVLLVVAAEASGLGHRAMDARSAPPVPSPPREATRARGSSRTARLPGPW